MKLCLTLRLSGRRSSSGNFCLRFSTNVNFYFYQKRDFRH